MLAPILPLFSLLRSGRACFSLCCFPLLLFAFRCSSGQVVVLAPVHPFKRSFAHPRSHQCIHSFVGRHRSIRWLDEFRPCRLRIVNAEFRTPRHPTMRLKLLKRREQFKIHASQSVRPSVSVSGLSGLSGLTVSWLRSKCQQRARIGGVLQPRVSSTAAGR